MIVDIDALEKAALAATPQDIDTAQIIDGADGKYIDCPCCDGEGSVNLEGDYCNYDGAGIGVQFYGIGREFGDAERFFRAANPAAVIELIRRLREAERQADEWLCPECNTVHPGLESLDLTCPSCRNGQMRPSSKQQRIVEDLLMKAEQQRDQLKAELDAIKKDIAIAATCNHVARMERAEQQREVLLAALKKFVDSHEECADFEGFAAQIVSMDDYHEAQKSIDAAEGGV